MYVSTFVQKREMNQRHACTALPVLALLKSHFIRCSYCEVCEKLLGLFSPIFLLL